MLHVDAEVYGWYVELLLLRVEIQKRLSLSVGSQRGCTGSRDRSFLLVQAETRSDLEARRCGCAVLKACEDSFFVAVGETGMKMLLFLHLGPTNLSLGQPLPLYMLLLFGLSPYKNETGMTFVMPRMACFHDYNLA